MNFKNKLLSFFFALVFIIPNSVYAYSSYVIPGGENIGIQINSDGILIVGFYKVNDEFIGKTAGFEVGDKIIAIDNSEVGNINEMIDEINKDLNQESINITFLRNKKKQEATLNLVKDENGVYKTGLYVKDQINGIGTLTYIDPETKIYGALGHEILEKTTAEKFEVKDGKIFKAEVTGIDKSTRGSPGEKNARFYSNEVYGTITENEKSGIFGTYTDTLPNTKAIEVGTKDDVKLGKAQIRTVLQNNDVETFDINIIKIDKDSDIKNILFEVVDTELLERTNGVVQGMSGSPIIQNNKIIGAVTHVIVNDSKKGYGIFITTMLEEGEK